MAASNSSSSYKLRTLINLLCRYRVVSGGSSPTHQTYHRNLPPYDGGSRDQGLRFISFTSRACSQSKEKDQSERVQLQPAKPIPPKFGFFNWVGWLLGSIVTFVLPFWKNKWDNMLTLEGTAAKVVEEVEVVAEVVEKVATSEEKALEEVANQLPDNSKLKEAAQVLEHASSEAAHDAQLIENIINKVDDVKQDLEELGKMVEPIVDNIIPEKHLQN